MPDDCCSKVRFMELTIRRTTAADGPLLAALNALAFSQNPMFDPDIIADWVNSQSALDYFNGLASDDNYCIVALSGDEIVGYLSAEPASHIHRQSRFLEIGNLGVHPDHRRQGIASRLLKECETWADQEGYTRLELTCYSKNSGALAYYEQEGFEPVHVILEKSIKG